MELYIDMSQYAKAEPLLLRSLEILERAGAEILTVPAAPATNPPNQASP